MYFLASHIKQISYFIFEIIVYTQTSSLLVEYLTSDAVIGADFVLFVLTVPSQAFVFFCHVVLGCFLVFVSPQQIHHKNRLQEAQQHQTKNPNTVDH